MVRCLLKKSRTYSFSKHLDIHCYEEINQVQIEKTIKFDAYLKIKNYSILKNKKCEVQIKITQKFKVY